MLEIKTTHNCLLEKSGCRETKSRHTFQGSARTSPQEAQDDMDDVVEEEEWLQQVDEVYDKLSVQHPIYYDSYNLCHLCRTQKLGSFNVDMLKSICSHFEISF